MDERTPPELLAAQVICGVLAGPLFVISFTAIGARRSGYDWRRHTVSSLALGRAGWLQRANFILAGGLCFIAGRGLRTCSQGSVGPHAVPALVSAAGIGLIGSGVFVTDPFGGFPPVAPDGDESEGIDLERTASTAEGRMHNICAGPFFAGIPVAGLAGAVAAARSRDYRWALYSAASGLVMVGSFLLMGRAFAGAPRLVGKGGIFQRISIVSGFGWLAALSLRAVSSFRRC
jgi:hypothetical protein